MTREAADGIGNVSNQISGGVFIQAVIQGRDITVQLPPAVTPALSGLPAPSATFTGRGRQVEELLRALAPDEAGQGTVLVHAVAGLAGIGKTELVLQTAARALREPGWFPGGVLFVDLSGYDELRRVPPERALDGLLRALGLPAEHVPAELQDQARLYRSVLAAFAEQGRRLLVVVDNASAADQVRPLLPSDGFTRALVTSRHTLDVGARLYDLDVLAPAASVDLIRQVLRRARGPADIRVDEDLEAAGRVAELCGHLPLALQISAALLADTPNRPVASLAQALADAHRRLDQLKREDRAVRAAFDLSYQNLTNQQARLFRLLPVNPGPDVSTESVTYLADIDHTLAEGVLQDLARAHLVQPGTTWGRWRLHDLVRLYASERAEPDSQDQACGRLLDHYAHVADVANRWLRGVADTAAAREFADQGSALAWLDAERLNLLAAASMAANTGRDQIAQELPFRLGIYLDQRRRFDDWATATAISVSAARRLGNRHREGGALNNRGLALRNLRRFDEAITAHQDAAAIHRETGDRKSEGTALNNLGVALQEVRRFDEAITALQDAAAIYREAGDRHSEGSVLNNLGSALREVRQFDQAITACQDAVAIYRETGDRHREGSALNSLGAALQAARRFNEAITAYREYLAICRETGDRHGEAKALKNVGVSLQDLRRWDEAITALQDAVAIYREAGDRHGEGSALSSLGVALREVRQFNDAISACQDAVAIYRETGDRHGEAQAVNHLGLVLRDVGRFGEAISGWQDAAAIFREIGDRHGEAVAVNNLGLVLRDVGRFGEAITGWQDAAAIYREIGDRHGEAVAVNNLGLALRDAGRFDEAITAHQEAAAAFRETGDRHGEGNALDSLETTRRAADGQD